MSGPKELENGRYDGFKEGRNDRLEGHPGREDIQIDAEDDYEDGFADGYIEGYQSGGE